MRRSHARTPSAPLRLSLFRLWLQVSVASCGYAPGLCRGRPLAFRQTRRQGRRAKRLGGASGGPADLSEFVREVRLLAGGDVRCLALATISLAELVTA